MRYRSSAERLIITAGEDLDYLDRDRSDLSDRLDDLLIDRDLSDLLSD